MGYAGGTKKNPTYYDLGDHSESFQVDYDLKHTSFEKLLDQFWKCPNSCQRSGSVQYRSVIFYSDEDQKKVALASRERESKKRGYAIETPILPLDSFTLAEDYHQKYFLRQERELAEELTAIYPKLEDFANSTAAMKLNAYLAGHGSRNSLERDIDSFGLSSEGKRRLREFVGNFANFTGEGR